MVYFNIKEDLQNVWNVCRDDFVLNQTDGHYNSESSRKTIKNQKSHTHLRELLYKLKKKK